MASNIVELEFRDGKRWIPIYLADLMAGIETFRHTYEEAVGLANNRLTGNYLNRVQRQIVSDSFRRGGQ